MATKVETAAEHVGGITLDRRYASGSFSVADDGIVAFTLTSPDRHGSSAPDSMTFAQPQEIGRRGGDPVQIVARKRFAFFVGRRCRDSSVKAVAEELLLDWHTVKELDKQYMGEQLRRASQPAPKAIGIDEIAIGRGHSYRIVVSDLIRGRPIWFGGQDRSEASMDEFYLWLGPAKSSKIRLAVMDMWKAFRISTLKKGYAPQALIDTLVIELDVDRLP